MSTPTSDPFNQFIDGLHDTARSLFTKLPATYGLAGYDAQRVLGEWALTDNHPDRLGLIHGDVTGVGPIVQIHTTTLPTQDVVASLRYGDRDPGSVMLDEPDDDDEMPWFHRWERFAASSDIAIRVDGEPVPAMQRSNGNAWYAWTTSSANGVGLIIEAVNTSPEDIEVMRITDIKPYLDGHRSMLLATRRP